MKKIVLMLLMLLIVACKKENINKESSSEKKEVTKDNVFKVFVEILVNEDDKFQLFYFDDSYEGTYSTENIIEINVKGSNVFQVLQFDLPKDILPYKFRLDLGDNVNKNETVVEVKTIVIKLNNNEIIVSDLILDSFFQPNIYLERKENAYLRKIIGGKYDPFIISKPILIAKIELEL